MGDVLELVPPDLARRLTGRGPGRSVADLASDVRRDAEPSARAARCALGDGPGADALARELARLLPALGLEPDAVALRIDERAAEVARQHGSIGVAIEGRIYLDPAAFDPSTADGREVLAHELTHVAQWRLGRSRGAGTGLAATGRPAATGLEHAELEAATTPRSPSARRSRPASPSSRGSTWSSARR